MDHREGEQPGPVPDQGGSRRKKRLTDRALWERKLGWEYIKAIKAAGREVFPEDLPPELKWETPVWMLYSRIWTQWRRDQNGAVTGLDYNPAIALMQGWGWELDFGLELLQAIELGMMEKID